MIEDDSLGYLSSLETAGDVEIIESLLKEIVDSPLESHKKYYEYVVSFHKKHGVFPDSRTIEERFDGLELPKDVKPWTRTLAIVLLSDLKEEKLQKRINDFLDRRDFEGVSKEIVLASSKREGEGFYSEGSIVEDYSRLSESSVGIMSGVREVDELLKGMSYSNLHVIAAPPSNFKCVTGETRVHTSEGYIQIKSLFRGDQKEDTFEPLEIEVSGGKTSKKYFGGVKEVIKVVTPHLEIKGTPIHPIKIEENGRVVWRELGKIRVGDKILMDVPQGLLFGGGFPEISHLRGWVMGYFVGRGKVLDEDLIFTGDNETLDKIEEVFVKDIDRIRLWGYLIVRGAEVGDWKELEGGRIPEWVYRSNIGFIRGFIEGVEDSMSEKVPILHERFKVIPERGEGFIRALRDLYNLLGVFPVMSFLRRELILVDEVDRESIDRGYFLSEVVDNPVRGNREAVYDLSVPGTHTFVSNGVYSHNTTYGTSIGYNAAVRGKFNVIQVTFEMLPRDMWFNLMARHSSEMGLNLPAELLKKGLLSQEQAPDLSRVVEDWKNLDRGRYVVLTPSDIVGYSQSELEATIRRVEDSWSKEGYDTDADVFILDYIQKVSAYRGKGEDEKEFCNAVVGRLLNIARDWKTRKGEKRGLVVVILAQINREGEVKLRKGKPATMNMLAELNSLERDAHTVQIMFSSEQMRLSNTLKIQIVKNRGGRVMPEPVSIFVNPESYTVGNADLASIFSGGTSDLISGLGGMDLGL